MARTVLHVTLISHEQYVDRFASLPLCVSVEVKSFDVHEQYVDRFASLPLCVSVEVKSFDVHEQYVDRFASLPLCVSVEVKTFNPMEVKTVKRKAFFYAHTKPTLILFFLLFFLFFFFSFSFFPFARQLHKKLLYFPPLRVLKFYICISQKIYF